MEMTQNTLDYAAACVVRLKSQVKALEAELKASQDQSLVILRRPVVSYMHRHTAGERDRAYSLNVGDIADTQAKLRRTIAALMRAKDYLARVQRNVSSTVEI